MSLKLKIGLKSVGNYKRLDYEIWYALAEYVDNSTQSYFNKKAILDKSYGREGRGLEVSIAYDRDGENFVLRVSDNEMGMEVDELEHALNIDSTSVHRTGRFSKRM